MQMKQTVVIHAKPLSTYLFLLLCGLFGINSSFTATAITVPLNNDTDQLALVSIKGEIHGDPFEVLEPWNNSLHFCQWKGISCGRRHQRVTILNLPSLSLEGTLSPFIGNLSFLRVINLTGNNFRGPLPQEIGSLFRLRDLLLGNNFFESRIPASLSNCSDLRHIRMFTNHFSGEIPAEISSLSKLLVLDLSSNQFSGVIPPSLGNLTTLTNLSLQYNKIGGSIPVELGSLANLQYLNLATNNLSGAVPYTLYNLSSMITFFLANNSLSDQLPLDFGLNFPNLEQINIDSNQFFGPIPSTIVNASRLTNIDFSTNYFSGRVPLNIGTLYELEYLQISYNRLGSENGIGDLGFIMSLTNCTKLKLLLVVGNGFRDEFPSSVANLSSKLAFLGLRENYITGKIPGSIENLINLVYLGLSDNILTGNIPDSIGRLTKLQELHLYNNSFSGNIPSSLGNITYISILNLWGNSLEGSIPASLINCTKLLGLDLSQNMLNGTIPGEVLRGSASVMTGLYLSQNRFTGPVPAEVGSLINIWSLYLDGNKLSGEIPSFLGNCKMLNYVNLSSNSFQGSVPSSLSNLQNILFLDLSSNNLSGQIPTFLTKLQFIYSLNLSFNNFYGEVPTDGIFANSSNFSVIGNDYLCGGLAPLHLPPCPKEAPQKQHKLKIFILVAIICAILLSACFFAFFYWRRETKQVRDSALSFGNLHMEVSYAELLQATDGFSSANLLGEGSYGSVYKGIIYREEERVVAVKVFHLHERGANKSFIAECEALRNVRHRNLVKIVSACSSINFKGEDFKALIYDFMPKGSLDTWLHPISVNDQLQEPRIMNLIQRLNVAIDVATALDYLHHHCHEPVIHCDLKPSNILLDDDLTAHVSDFGLARLLLPPGSTSYQPHTSSSAIKGTVGYAAPEYGVGTKASKQGDVYSYGILLLELFTGKRPTDSTFTDNLSLHVYVKIAVPEQVMRVIDPQLSLQEEGESGDSSRNNSQQIMASILRVGVICSAELPAERMDIEDAIKELHLIKKSFVNLRRGISIKTLYIKPLGSSLNDPVIW